MLRNLVLGSFAAIAAFWSYFFWDRSTDHLRQLSERDARIAVLETDMAVKDQTIEDQAQTITEQTEEIQRLELAKQLLRLDHRVASIRVVRQGPATDGSDGIETEVVFTELDDTGQPIGEGESMTIKGKRLYIDGLVIKFDDDYIEAGDALRGTSVCLFQGIFSEKVSPEDGIKIDSKVPHPLPFQGDKLPDPLYTQLFEKIWDYANDPEEARRLGVRAIQGEAPSIEARPGKTYRVELRQSGGVTIRTEE
ncbi:hypothetical protein Poly30_10540 [Planctomycetes bacterium Poly30]|uniref:Uncharacterized protein n=1 Tax=Saltatorellus ferox TaxID=2528018 RepID=A0A518EN89_9BACT|nr:hypothetical protein Poly30_10540 [Planctomycetes bacterium Poly30]